MKQAARLPRRVRRRGDRLAAPYSPQERWENQSGYSPNSIAAQIAGLVCAAEIARENGDDASARAGSELADRWQSKVKDWTVTPNGPLSSGPYFLRLTKDGDPDRRHGRTASVTAGRRRSTSGASSTRASSTWSATGIDASRTTRPC